MSKQIKINVRNFHMAKVTEKDGVLAFDTPEHIPGVEQVGRVPMISSGKKYGDGIVRFSVSKKNSYEITIAHNQIPTEWKSYLEGTTIASGVESASSEDVPGMVAIGWEVEKTGGKKEFIWFLYGTAEPITVDVQQSEDNVNFTSDSLKITCMEHTSLKRFYTLVDTELEANAAITAETFFSKVQTTDTIAKAAGA